LTVDQEVPGSNPGAPYFFTSFLFFSIGAGTQGLHLEPLHQPFFVKGFFEIGSCKLFAEAGFELQSS
jgi:hypothetical protein